MQTHSTQPLKVAVSYAWEGDYSNPKWVVTHLVNRLREEYGIDAYCDQTRLRGGGNIAIFMEEMREAERILVVCTPAYIKKLSDGNSGVSYEAQQLRSMLVTNNRTIRIVPVFRCGDNIIDITPPFLPMRYGYDLRGEPGSNKYEEQFRELVADLHGTPKEVPIGTKRYVSTAKVDDYRPSKKLLCPSSSEFVRNLVADIIANSDNPSQMEYDEIVKHFYVEDSIADSWPGRYVFALGFLATKNGRLYTYKRGEEHVVTRSPRSLIYSHASDPAKYSYKSALGNAIEKFSSQDISMVTGDIRQIGLVLSCPQAVRASGSTSTLIQPPTYLWLLHHVELGENAFWPYNDSSDAPIDDHVESDFPGAESLVLRWLRRLNNGSRSPTRDGAWWYSFDATRINASKYGFWLDHGDVEWIP